MCHSALGFRSSESLKPVQPVESVRDRMCRILQCDLVEQAASQLAC